MEKIQVFPNGIYKTIGTAMGVSMQAARSACFNRTHKKKELVTALRDDMLEAQRKVLEDYRAKGLI